MNEIRPIRPEEAEDFLKLLCECFDLDFERAQAIFYREPMFDLNRKWALFHQSQIESILTTVPLKFGWGAAIGIAGVATRPSKRRKGFGGELLKEVLSYSQRNGEGAALLFAKQTELYCRVGFEVLDEVIRAPIRSDANSFLDGMLSFEEVEQIYNDWAEHDPNRLRRDQRRWGYWKWNLRVCCPFATGYLCVEGTTVRECVVDTMLPFWPVHEGTEWFGLRGLAEHLNIPLAGGTFDLHLMGHGFAEPPQMFLTDQF